MRNRRAWTTGFLVSLGLVVGCSGASMRGNTRTDPSQGGQVPVQSLVPPETPAATSPPEPAVLEEVHEFKQGDFPLQTVERIQGKKGVEVTTAFQQGVFGALDILVVVDNSPSMAEEQANLATRLEALLSSVDKSDWRIAVTTTDPKDPCLVGIVSKGDPDSEARFATLVANVGTRGTGLERPFLRVAEALECPMAPGSTASWLRGHSALAILILSDEDNCYLDREKGYQCEAQDQDPSFLLKAVQRQRTLVTEARIYGIISQPEKPCSTALAKGTLIAQAVVASGGLTGDLCDGDYSPILREISGHVAKILKVDLALDFEPAPGTTKVSVDGVTWNGFGVQGRQVIFQEIPPFGSRVKVSYLYGQEGVYGKLLDLGQVPIDKSLSVLVEDEVLKEDQFRFDSQTKSVELMSMPPEGTRVRAKFVAAAGLRKVFPVGSGEFVPGSLRVWVDDVEMAGYQFDPASGDLALPSAPQPGAKITVKLARQRPK